MRATIIAITREYDKNEVFMVIIICNIRICFSGEHMNFVLLR